MSFFFFFKYFEMKFKGFESNPGRDFRAIYRWMKNVRIYSTCCNDGALILFVVMTYESLHDVLILMLLLSYPVAHPSAKRDFSPIYIKTPQNQNRTHSNPPPQPMFALPLAPGSC